MASLASTKKGRETLDALTSRLAMLRTHVEEVRRCQRCRLMESRPVVAEAVLSPVMLVGQAPGIREPGASRLFAWTAGTTLFRWIREHTGVEEEVFRARVTMVAVCRCFPGKKLKGGDRVPNREEIENCAQWLRRELEIIQPRLILSVGKLSISRFFPEVKKLDEIVGTVRPWVDPADGRELEVIALPHPSGASTWHQREPGKGLLRQALALVKAHPAFRDAITG